MSTFVTSQWVADGRPTLKTGHWVGGLGLFGGRVDFIPDIDPKYYVNGNKQSGLAPVQPPPYISSLPGPTNPSTPAVPPPPPVLDGTSATWGRAIVESFGTRKVDGVPLWVSAIRSGDQPPLLTSLPSAGGNVGTGGGATPTAKFQAPGWTLHDPNWDSGGWGTGGNADW